MGVKRYVATGRIKPVSEFLIDYWAKVKKCGEDECWPWNGFKTPFGYGHTYFYGSHIPAHRLAYIIHHLKDPYPLLICHRCDNPECQNPSHYFLSDQIGNMADMKSKGRSHKPRGSGHNKAVLNEDQVRDIRLRIKTHGRPRGTLTKLAKEFGVGHSAMFSILRGDCWKHVTV